MNIKGRWEEQINCLHDSVFSIKRQHSENETACEDAVVHVIR